MAQDFRAIMEHNLTYEDLVLLPEKLDAKMWEIEDLLVKIGLKDISDRPWTWAKDPDSSPPVEEWLKGGDITISGPESLFFRVGKNLLQFGCWIRWRDFLNEPLTRKCLRIITYQFSTFFNSDITIYVPHSGWKEGENAIESIFNKSFTMKKIIEKLKKDAGSPSASISKIYNRAVATVDGKVYESFSGKGYYIDNFEDINIQPSGKSNYMEFYL